MLPSMAHIGAADSLTAVLAAALQPGTRQKAEQHLAEAERQPGYGLALVQTTIRHDVAPELRQMAALLLKNFIRYHWTPEAENFQDSAIGETEKASIRQELPQGLADPNTRICTAVAMAIACVAKTEVPEVWPSLPHDLVRAISLRHNTALVAGAVRCLSLFVDELEEEQVVPIIPILLPELQLIVSQPGLYELSVQRRAVAIMRGFVIICANAVGPYKVQAVKALVPYLKPWLEQCCNILRRPYSPTSHREVGAIKLEVLKALVPVVTTMGKHIQDTMPAILNCCWALLHDSMAMYYEFAIGGNNGADTAEVDSDGNTIDLKSLISQLFEFMLTVASSTRFRKHLQGGINLLFDITISYMQMTAEQEEKWSEDPNQLLAEEDELVFSVRTSGSLLLEELFTAFPALAAAALSSAVQVHFRQATELKASGHSQSWKKRETALFAVGALSEQLLEGAAQAHFQASSLLDNVLEEDLPPGAPSFLEGRALWVASRLADAIDRQKAIGFLRAAAAGIARDRPAVVQVGACRALCVFSAKLDAADLRPLLPSILNGLGGLLLVFTEEALHLVLETLAAVIKCDPEAAVEWQPHIVPPVLQIWAAHASDPLLCTATVEVFEALAAVPAGLPDLQVRVLPVLSSIASKPEANPPVLIEGALDLATALLRPSSPQSAAAVHGMFSGTVMTLLRVHDDPGVLQSCCEYLRVLISIGEEHVLTFGGADPNTTLREILAALNRLLQAGMGDSAALYVGQVLTMLLRKVPERTIGAIAEILPAAVAKLATAKSSPLIVALLSVFAQLVHTNAVQLIDYLAAAPSPGARGSALDLVLQIWTERALEFQGAHDIQLSTTALALLLETGHPALADVKVKGKQLDLDGGIRTRSRAAKQGERWQWVPAPAKLFSLLADTLLEAKEGGLKADDEDEWEEVSDSEDGSAAPSSHAGKPLHGIRSAQDVPASVLKEAMAADDDTTDWDGREEGWPLADVNLTDFVAGQLKTLAQQDRPLFDTCCSLLSPVQLQAVQDCF